MMLWQRLLPNTFYQIYELITDFDFAVCICSCQSYFRQELVEIAKRKLLQFMPVYQYTDRRWWIMGKARIWPYHFFGFGNFAKLKFSEIEGSEKYWIPGFTQDHILKHQNQFRVHFRLVLIWINPVCQNACM